MYWVVAKNAYRGAASAIASPLVQFICCTMDLKAKGNALFRDGDVRGAANAFRRAIEGADQVNR